MKTSPSSLKPVNLSDSLYQHLHMYALAASAAGVSLLAMAQPSEAEIVYTPANVTIGTNIPVSINPGAAFGAGTYSLIQYGSLTDNSTNFTG